MLPLHSILTRNMYLYIFFYLFHSQKKTAKQLFSLKVIPILPLKRPPNRRERSIGWIPFRPVHAMISKSKSSIYNLHYEFVISSHKKYYFFKFYLVLLILNFFTTFSQHETSTLLHFIVKNFADLYEFYEGFSDVICFTMCSTDFVVKFVYVGRGKGRSISWAKSNSWLQN